MIYTIIAGVNGAGKSSLTGTLKTERSDLGFIIDVDKIAAENKCSPVKAGRIAVGRLNEYLSKGIAFTQETTLSGRKTLNTVKAAREKGYVVRMYYVGLNSLEESLKRISNRVEKGGHNVESRIVQARYAQRVSALTRVLPYCNYVLFLDNENGFEPVGEYKNGELRIMSNNVPEWMTTIDN